MYVVGSRKHVILPCIVYNYVKIKMLSYLNNIINYAKFALLLLQVYAGDQLG